MQKFLIGCHVCYTEIPVKSNNSIHLVLVVMKITKSLI